MIATTGTKRHCERWRRILQQCTDGQVEIGRYQYRDGQSGWYVSSDLGHNWREMIELLIEQGLRSNQITRERVLAEMKAHGI
jgi:hypothetical protein